MICDACHRLWQRADRKWSEGQWKLYSPFVTLGDGWRRNCCKDCTDDFSNYPYYTHKLVEFDANRIHSSFLSGWVPPCTPDYMRGSGWQHWIPTPPASSDEVALRSILTNWQCVYRKVLREMLPDQSEFWVKVHTQLGNIAHAKKEEILRLNRETKQADNYPFTRRLARIGAMKVPSSLVKFIPADKISHTEPSLESAIIDSETYVDVGNAIYSEILNDIGPQCVKTLNMSNRETIGNVLECFMALYWLFRFRGLELPASAHFVYRSLCVLGILTYFLHVLDGWQSMVGSVPELLVTLQSEVTPTLHMWKALELTNQNLEVGRW